MSQDRLLELEQADKEGRCIVLPCRLGDTVFTIEEDYFGCKNCKHQSEAKFDKQYKRTMCDFPDGRHCPYYIKEHSVEGFRVEGNKDGKAVLSAPGEWGCEGLEHYFGIDDTWYLTRSEAESAMEVKS